MTSPNLSLKLFYLPLSTWITKRDRVKVWDWHHLRELPHRCAVTVPGPLAHSPLCPITTTVLVGLDTTRVGLMKMKNPQPLKQHCQHVPLVPSCRTKAVRAGCDPRPALTPPSQARLLTQLLPGSLPCICRPLSNRACPASHKLLPLPKGTSSTPSLSFPLCSAGISCQFLAAHGAASSRLRLAGCPSPRTSLLFSPLTSWPPLTMILA